MADQADILLPVSPQVFSGCTSPTRSAGWLLAPWPVRGDDVEVEVEPVQQPGVGGQRGRVAVELDLPGSGELCCAAGLEDHADQAGLRAGDGQRGVGEAPQRAFSTPRLIHLV